MNAALLLEHYARIADAPDAIARLRRFVLDLAVRGKLVEQDEGEEPASELLKRLSTEKARKVKEGQLKRSDPVENLGREIAGNTLPAGWTFTTLQSICSSITDGDHLPPPKAETGIPFLVIGNVRSQSIEFEGSRFVPQSYFDSLDAIRRPAAGDLRDTLVGSYGIPVQVRDDRPFCVQRHIGILRPLLIDVIYLARAMESRFVFDQSTAIATGIAQKTVPLSGLRKIVVPLPPLAEQRRIAAKVDELMALCDQLEAARTDREAARDTFALSTLAKLNTSDPETFGEDARFALANLAPLTTRADQIKQLRQTILNLAVRGKLVEQDMGDEPAAELLKRIATKKEQLVRDGTIKVRKVDVRARSKPLELTIPASWALTDLGSVALKITDGAHKTPTYVERGIPFVSVKDFSSGHLNFSKTRFIPESEHSILYKRCDPRRGDILIGRIGTLGKAVLIETDIEFSLFVSVGLIRFDHASVNPEFLRLQLNSPFVEDEFDRIKIGGGTHTNKLNLGDLQTVALLLPPLAEQRRIVAKVDELMALCDQLEASLTTGELIRSRMLESVLNHALKPA